MGLDSVELVMEIENYFDISIPDPEAETIYTIQQMVDVVAKYRDITSEEKTLQSSFFQRIKTCLPGINLSLEDKIALFIGTEKQDYDTLSACLKTTIPFPDFSTNEGTRFIDKIKRFISWIASYNAEELTFENLIDATLANNYRNVINPSAITNKYEIYIAVAGITADKIGVDFYEIAPGKSFTTDLGID